MALEQSGLEHIHWFYRFSMKMGWKRYIGSLLPKVLANFENGQFRPGAIPLRKRCYSTRRIPDDLVK